MARKKRQFDPYAEESTDIEDNDTGIEPNVTMEKNILKKKMNIKPCGHASRAVNLKNIKKNLKNTENIGACSVCSRARMPLGLLNESGNDNENVYVPVIWMCAFCGTQGCDRKHHKHALHHFLTPRSDPHCLAINTREWTVWCYKCDNEVLTTSCKKVDECLQYIKNIKITTHRSSSSTFLTPVKTNLTSQYSGSDSRLHLSTFSEENFRNKKLARNSINMEALLKTKGLMNLGNTCFFNSVMQNLSQTHLLTQLLSTQLQAGQRMLLPGRCTEKRDSSDYRAFNGAVDSGDDDIIDMKPLELHLSEAGPLSMTFSTFLKEMNSMSKYNNTIKPEQLFRLLCKKSTQFEVSEQEDAHELLRCFLDGIRSEEIVRMKTSILKAFALNEKSNRLTMNEKLRKLIKGYGLQATHTIIDDIFGGQLISTVICEQCQWSSQRFEPFMDLSLPINEEKGKPKKTNIAGNDTVTNSYRRRGSKNNNENLSKHQTKRQKNSKTRGKQPYVAKCGGNKTQQAKVVEERRNRRLTEKRCPEDIEFLLQKQEEEQHYMGSKKKATNCSKRESEKFMKLVQQKSLQSPPSDGESTEEDMEYDCEDDDNDSFGTMRRGGERDSAERSKASITKSEEDSSMTQDAAVVGNETDESGKSLGEDSPRHCSSKETSDADVEDNNDSDNAIGQFKPCKRQPSIVIEESLCDQVNGNANNPPLDHRLLSSCLSYDLLCCSASDTERYYTAAGGDTMDELDITEVPDNLTVRSGPYSATRGKGDSISLFSGEALGHDQESEIFFQNNNINDITFQVNDMKIISGSKYSLLNGTNYINEQFGSVDDMLSFDDTENKDEYTIKTKKQWMAKSVTTLAPRYQTDRQECSIMSCLTNFSSPELLTGSNKISCENCSKIHADDNDETSTKLMKSSASKQLLILSPPAVLTLQLKRFQQAGSNLKKVNKFVEFPLVLDLAPYVSSISVGLHNIKQKQNQVLYALYGIVQHSGRLDSGHYVAYVRSRPIDPTRLTKRFLNTKPSSEYAASQLMEELMQKEESLRKSKSDPFKKLDIEKVTEEVKKGRWSFVSDTYVSEVNLEKVMKAQAYLLFYERIL